ncbi:MAG: hypothetical protein ACYCT9_04420 [Leptospirillum sp.]
MQDQKKHSRRTLFVLRRRPFPSGRNFRRLSTRADGPSVSGETPKKRDRFYPDAPVAVPKGLRSFVRVSRKTVLTMAKFGKDKKERIDKGVKKLLSFARRTMNRVPEALGNARKAVRKARRKKDGVLQKTLTRLVEKVTEESRVLERVITQTVNRIKERPVEDKRIYSTHEPHVTCITKNKAGKRHEYGVKVSLSVDANGFVVAHREYPDNRHDG